LSHLIGFFFQAEDGIRDRTVTGVQTCALPISRDCRSGDRAIAGRENDLCKPDGEGEPGNGSLSQERPECNRGGYGICVLDFSERSEERRVGKECRSRCGW